MDLNPKYKQDEIKQIQEIINHFEKPAPVSMEDMPPKLQKIINLDVSDFDSESDDDLTTQINSKLDKTQELERKNKCLREDIKDIESQLTQINQEFMICDDKLLKANEHNMKLINQIKELEYTQISLIARNIRYQKIISKKNSAIICNILAWGLATTFYFLL